MSDLPVPQLPGLRSNKFQPRARPHTLKYVDGSMSVEPRGMPSSAPAAEDQPRGDATMRKSMTFRGFESRHSLTTQRKERAENKHPAPFATASQQLVKHDIHGTLDEELRFSAYFKEAVPECPGEEYRVRSCHLHYFISDDTMGISEAREENSGMPQGTFLKRTKVPNPAGGFYALRDIGVGKEVTIFSRRFRITDCDATSRERLAAMGLPQGPAEATPVGTYNLLLATRKQLQGGGEGVNRGKRCTPMKTFQEAALGKEVDATKKLGAYLRHDRKVLRFFCAWDNRDSLYGALERFVLHLYLADQTMEIRETHDRNDGKDPFPLLLKRGRVPKQYHSLLHDDRDRSVEPDADPAEYYRAADLRLGGTVSVFGRDLLLLDCDEFTKRYYKEVHGLDMTPVALPKPAPMRVEHPVPPPTGFGSEGDSMASVLHLRPKKPRQDLRKMLHNDRKILRFAATLESAAPEDVGRSFVIAYYLADDTVMVFEPPQRNSGIIGGKLLERGRHKAPDGHYYAPIDLQIGSHVALAGHVFLVHDMDDYSFQYMSKRPRKFPFADIQRTLAGLHNSLVAVHGEARVLEALKALDKDGSGAVPLEAASEVIKGLSKEVGPQALSIAIHHMGKGGRFPYVDFVSAMRMAADRASSVAASAHADGAQAELQRVMWRFYRAYKARRHELVTMLRKFGERHHDALPAVELRRSLRQFTSVTESGLTEDDLAMVTNYFFPDGPRSSTLDVTYILSECAGLGSKFRGDHDSDVSEDEL